MMVPLFVWQGKSLHAVDPLEIMALSAEGAYTKLHLTDNRSYLVRSTLADMLKKTPEGFLFRVHRTWAVSVFYIDKVEKEVVKMGPNDIPIGKLYYDGLISKLQVI